MAEKAGTKKDKATEGEAKTRTILTPQQRIEKAKADLAALEQKEKVKAEKKIAAAEEKLAAVVKRRDDLNAKVAEAEAEVAELKKLAGQEDNESSDQLTV